LQINKLAAGFSAALITAVLMGGTAEASCRDTDTCPQLQFVKKAQVAKKKVKHVHVRLNKTKKVQMASRKTKHVQVASRKLSSKRIRTQSALAVVPRGRGHVVEMIKAQAPGHGVPTWFALRIAKIESGYNPRARGAAGEIGVFQLKCQTARGLGYRGSCGGLYNAATNVQYGLKHLSLAVRSSKGNLKLAASKHNGGLGRKTLVRKYVAMVF
jgi:soluble lytic murein transglycosylase-like protein